MPTKPSDAVPVGPAVIWAGGLAFAVLATLNAGGYRYGVADQAFYIPAILHQLDPSLYPRDWTMIGAQGRYFLVDEIGAWLVRVSGLALPVWFAIAQALTLASLYGGAIALGRAVLSTPWALMAWVAALTLRHRIAKTGANTLEGYFHPRMLVFGVGLIALAEVVRGRRVRPILLLLGAAALHPTTAALFLAIVLVAIAVIEMRGRQIVVTTGAVAAVVAVCAVATGIAAITLTPMTPAWRALVATKDYTFPTAWSLSTWLINLAGPGVLVATAWQRHRERRLTNHEFGIVAGALALVAGFVASLPLISAGVPLAVQLQTSRAFWPVETLATLYLVWWLVDRRLSAAPGDLVARGVVALLVAVSVARGLYVGFVESPDRPTFAFDLPDDDWGRALAWIRTETPADTYVLADPGHAWKTGMGTAVRIGARRDVFLEETKDVAMAMYSRDAAERVSARIGAVQAFDAMSDVELRTFGARHGLTVLVSLRPLDLPVRFQAGAVRVYALTAR